MIEPTRHLVAPEVPRPSASEGFANPMSIFDTISISYWVNEVIKGISGYDAVAELTKPFAGDWEAYWRAGDAFANLGLCLYDIGSNIHEGARELDAEWDGNAGDAAFLYFARLASVLGQQYEALREIQKTYHDAARGVWVVAEQVGGILRSLIDRAIVAGIAAAAGTATAGTGIGAIAGYGVAAWQALEIIRLISDASMKIRIAGGIVFGTFAQLMAMANQGGQLAEFPLPEPYRHPAAA